MRDCRLLCAVELQLFFYNEAFVSSNTSESFQVGYFILLEAKTERPNILHFAIR